MSKDNFKLVRRWLEKDENTLVLTRDFLHKIRNEMKRTFKLTLYKIKNPGSLGANPKKDLLSKKVYPTLPEMKEETGGTTTDRIESWANNDTIYRPSAPAIEHEEPPYYDESVRLQYRPTSFGHQGQHNQHYNQERHQPMVPMDATWLPSGAGAYQMQGNIINTRESVE